MKRRELLGTFVLGGMALRFGLANAQSYSEFDRLLGSLTPEELLKTASDREFQFRRMAVTETQGARLNKSNNTISERATKLITTFEVSSEQYYRSKLIHPIWPQGDSGITIGIGYDIGFVSAKTFRNDWKDLLPQKTISILETAAQKKAARAKELLPNYTHLVVPWDKAQAQFNAFLPYVIGETEAVFPNAKNFKDKSDCRGALVSLVYNRGSAVANTDRRREMLAIRNHMAARDFKKIPAEIRSMTRLWMNKGLPGLIERRELEALLFERGLENE